MAFLKNGGGEEEVEGENDKRWLIDLLADATGKDDSTIPVHHLQVRRLAKWTVDKLMLNAVFLGIIHPPTTLASRIH